MKINSINNLFIYKALSSFSIPAFYGILVGIIIGLIDVFFVNNNNGFLEIKSILIFYGATGFFIGSIISILVSLFYFKTKSNNKKFALIISSVSAFYLYTYIFIFINRVVYKSSSIFNSIALISDFMFLILSIGLLFLSYKYLLSLFNKINLYKIKIILTPLYFTIVLFFGLKIVTIWLPDNFNFDRELLKNNKKNIIVIIVDSLRPDHLGIYDYPFNTSPSIDKFGKEGIVFTNAFSIGNCSKYAGPALMPPGIQNSRFFYNEEFGVQNFNLNPTVEYFSQNGYNFRELYDYKPSFINHIKNSLIGKEFIYQFYNKFWEIFQTSKAMRWVRKNPYGSILYLCYNAPHQPYSPPYLYRNKFSDKNYPKSNWLKNNLKKNISWDNYKTQMQLYDAEISFIDDQIGRLYNLLSESGLKNNTTVIITSDQGEELFERDDFGHSCKKPLYNELIKVPLIIWSPGLLKESKTISKNVSTADIYPTIKDILKINDSNLTHEINNFEIKTNKPIKGKSLIPLIINENEEVTPVFAYSEFGYSVIHNNWKLLVHNDSTLLFNFLTDPNETIDLSNNNLLKVKELKEFYEFSN